MTMCEEFNKLRQALREVFRAVAMVLYVDRCCAWFSTAVQRHLCRRQVYELWTLNPLVRNLVFEKKATWDVFCDESLRDEYRLNLGDTHPVHPNLILVKMEGTMDGEGTTIMALYLSDIDFAKKYRLKSGCDQH